MALDKVFSFWGPQFCHLCNEIGRIDKIRLAILESPFVGVLFLRPCGR